MRPNVYILGKKAPREGERKKKCQVKPHIKPPESRMIGSTDFACHIFGCGVRRSFPNALPLRLVRIGRFLPPSLPSFPPCPPLPTALLPSSVQSRIILSKAYHPSSPSACAHEKIRIARQNRIESHRIAQHSIAAPSLPPSLPRSLRRFFATW